MKKKYLSYCQSDKIIYKVFVYNFSCTSLMNSTSMAVSLEKNNYLLPLVQPPFNSL